MGKATLTVVWGDFLLDDVPSAALDEETLAGIRDAFQAAGWQGVVGVRVGERTDSLVANFPLPCVVTWGKEVDDRFVITVGIGTFTYDQEKKVISQPTIVDFNWGCSFPVAKIRGKKAHRKMYTRETPGHQRLQEPIRPWRQIETTLRNVFGQQINIVSRQEGNLTVVDVWDRGTLIVSFSYDDSGIKSQHGICLSGAQERLSPLAVVAAYFNLREKGGGVVSGAFNYLPPRQTPNIP